MIVSNLQEFYLALPLNASLIAIDYGSKKLGLAISNKERTVAMPLNIISGVNLNAQITALQSAIQKYEACGIVLGLPVHMSGELSEQSKIVVKFAEKLEKYINLPIYLQDERLTTKAANNFLKSFGIKRKMRNNNDDSVAASMILETVLNSIKNSI